MTRSRDTHKTHQAFVLVPEDLDKVPLDLLDLSETPLAPALHLFRPLTLARPALRHLDKARTVGVPVGELALGTDQFGQGLAEFLNGEKYHRRLVRELVPSEVIGMVADVARIEDVPVEHQRRESRSFA